MRYTAIKTGLLGLLLSLVVGLSGCTEKQPLSIGFIGGLSGRVADLGTAGRNGATLAIEQQNLKGPVQGRMLKLIAVDDQQNVQSGIAAIESLLEKNVTAIIGPMTSSMAVEMVPLANRAETVIVSPTANTEQLANTDDYFFRVISSTSYYARHLADFLYNDRQLRRVSIIYDLNNAAFTESFQSSFRDSFAQLGGKVTRTRTFRSGSDMSIFSLSREAIGPETEGVFVLASALDAALICLQIEKIAPDLIIAGTGWSATEKLVELGGAAVEGIFLQQFFDRDNQQPSYLAFRDAYQQRFGTTPGFASVAAYDATNVVIEALKQTDPSRSIKQAIVRTANFQGVQQPIRINSFGDADRTPYISTVRNGRFVVQQ